MNSLEEKVKQLVYSALQENNSLFLVHLSVDHNHNIKVVIDSDKGVGIDDCIELSRAIEHSLDREEEDFSLEVTSYGISEPLIVERQYIKNIGRTLSVQTTNGESVEGKLILCENGCITIEVTTREPKTIGKGKVTVTKQISFPIDQIKQAKIIIKI